MSGVQEQLLGHPIYQNSLSYASRQHQLPYIGGIEQCSQVPHRSRYALRPPSTHSAPRTPPPTQINSKSVKNQSTSLEDSFTADKQRTGTNPPKEDSDLILQTEARPISQDQLVAEVKGIYAGLVMVEAKCVEIDKKQAVATQNPETQQPKLSNEQWQGLIALHRTLLHEHHDFFLATQHPSASPALRRLAAKYTMPARMWRHGIHSFLELLRHRLPDSLDHMLAFIYLAYSMMALLYETVPAFEDTWIECLGDLARYRMAIEDEYIRDREVWTGVARFWYSRAADRTPAVGRLYHHLAILARPCVIQQWNLYIRALTCFPLIQSARENIMITFAVVLPSESLAIDVLSVKAHGTLFTTTSAEVYRAGTQQRLEQIVNHIPTIGSRFSAAGVFIAVLKIAALIGYGSGWEQHARSQLRRYLKARPEAGYSSKILTSESTPDTIKPFIQTSSWTWFRSLESIYHTDPHPDTMIVEDAKQLNTLHQIYSNAEADQRQALSESAGTRSLCLEDGALFKQGVHDTLGATGNTLHLPSSRSGQVMLWVGSYFGTTALCSALCLPLVVQLLYLPLLCCALRYVTARILAIAFQGALSFGYKLIWSGRSVPCAAVESCAPEDNQKLVQKLQQLRGLIAVTNDGTNTDGALKTDGVSLPMGVAGTVVASEPGVIGRMGDSPRASVTGGPTLLRLPNLSTQPTRTSRACALAMFTLYLRPVLAVAVEPGDLSAVGSIHSSATGHMITAKPVPTDLHLFPLPDWAFPLLCGSILGMCFGVAKLKRWEPSYVSGTLAATSWWLWLYLKRDPDISPWVSWT